QRELVWMEVRDADRDAPAAALGDRELRAPALDGRASTRDDDNLWLAAPVTDEHGATLGTVEIGLSLRSIEQDWERQRELILLSCAGFSVLVLIGLVGSTRAMVLNPLQRLARAAEAVGRGDSVAVVVESRDEVGRLGTAFNDMARAIHEREERLARAHADVERLLDGMRQAIFTFGPDLRVVGRASRSCAQVFGRAIAGVDVRELLMRGIPESAPEHHAIEAFLSVVFEVSPDDWAQLVELAPRELQLWSGTPQARELVVELVPLVEDGRIGQVMVLATDETETRRAQREIDSMRDRHAAELAAMRRMLAVGVQVFVEFEARSAARLGRVEQLVAADGESRGVIQELMRLVHGVRGGARALGLLELESALIEAEHVLAPVRDAVFTDTIVPVGWRAALGEALASARVGMAHARERLVAASPLGSDVLDQVTVSSRDLDELLRLRGRALPGLQRSIDRLCARPFAELVTGLGDAVEFWASAEAKRARLVVVGATARIDRTDTDGLRTAVVQIVRNAIAHGIELPEQRTIAGKPAVGRIEVQCEEDVGGPVIEIRDDGGGVRIAALRKRATALGLALRDDELIFADGLSSREHADDLAGRGVGMSAVRHELEQIGYRIELVETGKFGTCFRIHRATVALRRAGS
ncbi:MAG TPA: HAMP domain-containing protein, partial [Nannocystaceae bacterium]|nr:HAMP domain-containing protein [Nannocystaceae bacterium]